MKTNAAGLALIKRWEGLHLEAYPDPGSPRARHKLSTGKDDPGLDGAPWTIGWGHTHLVQPGMLISREAAEAFLREDVEVAERIVDAGVRVPLTSNQFSALVSFVFNVGPGKKDHKDGFLLLKDGRMPSILRNLNAREMFAAANDLLGWTRSAGLQSEGLRRRRVEERDLFLKPEPVV